MNCYYNIVTMSYIPLILLGKEMRQHKNWRPKPRSRLVVQSRMKTSGRSRPRTATAERNIYQKKNPSWILSEIQDNQQFTQKIEKQIKNHKKRRSNDKYMGKILECFHCIPSSKKLQLTQKQITVVS